MIAEARRLHIIDIFHQAGDGVVSITELSARLGVSEMTIRRDLDWLESRSILTRVHGGAKFYQAGEIEKSFDDRLKESNPQKQSIGWAAAQLVNEGDRIILDAGTTTQQIALSLTCKKNLTVITNNLPIGVELSRCLNIETIVLGGVLKHHEQCTVGGMVTQALSFLSADKMFLSCAGFSIKNGTSDPDMREVEVKQAMMRAANEIILVADSSKYGVTALVQVAPLKSIHKIVTDDAVPAEVVTEIESLGIKIITPERLANQVVKQHDG